MAGEIIIYDDLNKIKIGDGFTTLANLSFALQEIYVGNGDMPEGVTIQILTGGSDEEQELKDELKEYIDGELAVELAKRGQLKPEFANSVEELEENGDTTKLYVLPDGMIYACMLQKTEGEIVPNYKQNILDIATVYLNQRYNSSNVLKDATGYIAIDYYGVKSGDIIRINDTKVISASAIYNRVKYYNSSKAIIDTYSGGDARADQQFKLTTSNGVMSWVVGYYNATLGDDSTNTLPSAASNIAYMRANLYISSSEITEKDIEDLVITVNEEISYITTGGGTKYVWQSTGRAFVPADYEDRIIELEIEIETLKAENEALANRLENKADNILSVSEVFAPSPQLPADGSTTADFNAEAITTKQIYDYIDALLAKYPKYLAKETLGKDESGEFDWNRYTLCKRNYDAWQKVNYPKMYAWVNGSTIIYSVSVSPRIGDTLYSTTYVGTAKGTVTSVSNSDCSRMVRVGTSDVKYTRDATKDIEPTLVYTDTAYSPYYVGAYVNFKNKVYDANKSSIGTISTYSTSSMKDSNGASYVRYPLGDRDSEFKKPKTIVVGSNEHGRDGDPAEPAIISARMIKDLCECANANNPFLNLLKNNYMVIFCPIINPWGFDNSHKNYLNYNSVNIDRNFDTKGWGNDTSSGGQGEYGGSENETQYFMNTIVESGAKIVTANHGLGTQINSTTGEATNAGHCHYMLGRNNSKYNTSLLGIGEVMGANYNLAFTDYGEAPPENHAKTRSYIASVGAEGGAVEMQAREGFVKAGEGDLHTARILEADYTLLLQFLYMLIDNQD